MSGMGRLGAFSLAVHSASAFWTNAGTKAPTLGLKLGQNPNQTEESSGPSEDGDSGAPFRVSGSAGSGSCPFVGITEEKYAPYVSDVSRRTKYEESFRKFSMGGNDSALKLLVEKIEKQLITDDEDWPIEYGSYIGFMMRLGWHCAGSYRGFDGRGGCDGARIRFNPELNWADNANLNHAIDWIKKHFKYYLGGDDAKNMIKPEEDDAKDNVPRRLAPKGPAEPLISFGDLIQLINVVAMNQAGLEPEGFCFGRIDNVDGAESNQLNNKSFPLAPEEPDLIYINAAGFDFDPITKEETKVVNLTKTVIDIRKTFGNMGMNDSETVALIAGGHTFGRQHGKPEQNEKCEAYKNTSLIEGQCKNSTGYFTKTSGISGAWTPNPAKWDRRAFLKLLLFANWKLQLPGEGNDESAGPRWLPFRATGEETVVTTATLPNLTASDKQVIAAAYSAGIAPRNESEAIVRIVGSNENIPQIGDNDLVTEKHRVADKYVPKDKLQDRESRKIAFNAGDVALVLDDEYKRIAKGFYDRPESFEKAFKAAWYKLTTRDMGPKARCINANMKFGDDESTSDLEYLNVPNTFTLVKEKKAHHFNWNQTEIAEEINMAMTGTKDKRKLKKDFIRTAWLAASTYRYTDHLGGSDGAHGVDEDGTLIPEKLRDNVKKAKEALRAIQMKSGGEDGGPSMADLIAFAGHLAVGGKPNDDFCPGRTDSSESLPLDDRFFKRRADLLLDVYDEDAYEALKTNYPIHGGNWTVEDDLKETARKLGLKETNLVSLIGNARALLFKRHSDDDRSKLPTESPPPEQLLELLDKHDMYSGFPKNKTCPTEKFVESWIAVANNGRYRGSVNVCVKCASQKGDAKVACLLEEHGLQSASTTLPPQTTNDFDFNCEIFGECGNATTTGSHNHTHTDTETFTMSFPNTDGNGTHDHKIHITHTIELNNEHDNMGDKMEEMGGKKNGIDNHHHGTHNQRISTDIEP